MKKALLFVFITTLISFDLFSQTSVSGEQAGVWTKSASPYLVTGEITVPAGDTLFIEAGVNVVFQGYYKFTVNGNLQAFGNEQDSISFIPENTFTGWGGIRFENSNGISVLKYCKIEHGKTSSSSYPDNHGGAAALINSDAVFENCLFAHNRAPGDDDGMGGAVYAINTGSSSQTKTKFVKCKFVDNYAFGEGGALKFSGDLNSLIDSCTFIGNNCKYGGGAIALYSVYKTKIKNSLFANNFTEYGSGGGIQGMGNGNLFYVVNSTFYGNEARHGDGGGIYMTFSQAEIVNSIVWGNSGMYSNNIFLDMEAYANINYCDLPMPDGATGSHNINADPLFADVENLDFALTPHSPCVDAGVNVFLAGADTLVNITEFYGASADIGAYEFYPPGAADENAGVTEFVLEQNYPNPFNPTTTIKYSISANAGVETHGRASLRIYNILGEEIAVLVNKRQAPGNYSVQFDASGLPSGVYFYTLKVGDFVATKKMILLK